MASRLPSLSASRLLGFPASRLLGFAASRLRAGVHALLQALRAQQPAEHKAATAFQKHYLDVWTKWQQLATKQTTGSAILRPCCWQTGVCGVQRLQPGSASGTQAQESWHKNKLKKHMGLLIALDSFGASLAQFSSSRLQNLQAQNTPLPDVPGEPFPDKTLLYDSNFLMREGRTSAKCFNLFLILPDFLIRYAQQPCYCLKQIKSPNPKFVFDLFLLIFLIG